MKLQTSAKKKKDVDEDKNRENVPKLESVEVKTNTEFSFIKVWFTDQNSKGLKTEDNVNMNLIIGQIL